MKTLPFSLIAFYEWTELIPVDKTVVTSYLNSLRRVKTSNDAYLG
jgi:hypothetical protein